MTIGSQFARYVYNEIEIRMSSFKNIFLIIRAYYEYLKYKKNVYVLNKQEIL
jgi:hypothetical protein